MLELLYVLRLLVSIVGALLVSIVQVEFWLPVVTFSARTFWNTSNETASKKECIFMMCVLLPNQHRLLKECDQNGESFAPKKQVLKRTLELAKQNPTNIGGDMATSAQELPPIPHIVQECIG